MTAAQTLADNAVAEILSHAHGNAAEAQRLLLARLAEDFELLTAITQPYIRGIAAHAVDRVQRRRAVPEKFASVEDALKVWKAGFDKPAEKPGPSENHAANIRLLAKAQAATRMDAAGKR